LHEGDGWFVAGGRHTVEDWTECAQTHTQTDRQTKVRTVYPPVSLRSLGGYNKAVVESRLCSSYATHETTSLVVIVESKIWLESTQRFRPLYATLSPLRNTCNAPQNVKT